MPKLSLLLTKVHSSVHDLNTMKPKKKYSEPKLYTGGVDIKSWNKLSKKEKEAALKKQWYVRWSFRNPKTGKLVRQDNIKGGANYYKTKNERLEILQTLQKNLSILLKNGNYNPYEQDENDKTYSVEEAFKFALEIKEKTLAKTSYENFENRINRFKKYLLENGFKNRFITSITKKDVNNYLNEVLKKTSPGNRNNDRTDISSLFSILSNEEIIPVNFILKIPVLKSKPNKNIAFTEKEVNDIFNYLKKENNDIWLYYFCAHIYYGLFRNVEVVRIKIKDINLDQKLIYSNTKTGTYFKQIPQILVEEFYNKINTSNYPDDYFLFTKNDKPDEWLTRLNKKTGKKTITEEKNRRGYWGKRFSKVVKKKFNFSKNHTIYSLRHAAIGKMFIVKLNEYKESNTPNYEEKALDYIRTITNHQNNNTVKNYLREIGYYKIEDWSNILK